MNLFTEITKRMAIANGTCVSFFNQPKTHFSRPWVRPWDNRVNFTWMKRGFNACQKHPACTHLSSADFK